jgi:hypothetical protein
MAPAPVDALQPRGTHQSRDPLVIDPLAAAQCSFRVHPRPPIRTPRLFVNLSDHFRQFLIPQCTW